MNTHFSHKVRPLLGDRIEAILRHKLLCVLPNFNEVEKTSLCYVLMQDRQGFYDLLAFYLFLKDFSPSPIHLPIDTR